MSYKASMLIMCCLLLFIPGSMSLLTAPIPCGASSNPCPKDVVVDTNYQSGGIAVDESFHHDIMSDSTTVSKSGGSMYPKNPSGDMLRVPFTMTVGETSTSYLSFWFKDTGAFGFMFSFGNLTTDVVNRNSGTVSFGDKVLGVSSIGWNFLEFIRYTDKYMVTINNQQSSHYVQKVDPRNDVIFSGIKTVTDCSSTFPALTPGALYNVAIFAGFIDALYPLTIATDLMVLTKYSSPGVQVIEDVGGFSQGLPYIAVAAQISAADSLLFFSPSSFSTSIWSAVLSVPGFYYYNSKILSSFTLSGPKGSQYYLSVLGGTQSSFTMSLTGGILADDVFICFRSSMTLTTTDISTLRGTVLVRGDLSYPSTSFPVTHQSLRIIASGSLIMMTGFIKIPTSIKSTCDPSPILYKVGWRGKLDDVMVLNYVPSPLQRWALFSSRPPYNLLSNITLYSPLHAVVNNTVKAEIGLPLTIVGGYVASSDTPFPNQTEYGWMVKCNSNRYTMSQCYDSCALGSGDLSCSGSVNFCDHMVKVRNHVNAIVSSPDPVFGIPDVCVSKTSSDCDCEFTLPNHYYENNATKISFESSSYSIAEHLGSLPSSQYDLAPQTHDQFTECAKSCDGYCKECFSKAGSERSLLAFGNSQFTIYWFDDYINVAQDLSVRGCADCSSTTIYYGTYQMGSSRSFSFLVSGLFSRYQIPEELVSKTGDLSVEIKDAGGITLFAEVYKHVGVSTSTWKDCVFCTETAENVINTHWIVKLLIVILILIILKLVLMIVMIMINYAMWCNNWCRVAGNKMNVCCCCRKVREKVEIAYVVVSDINQEASSTSSTVVTDIDIESPTPQYVGTPPWAKPKVAPYTKSRREFGQRYTAVMMIVLSVCYPMLVSSQCSNGLAIDHATAKCVGGQCTVSPTFTGTIPTGAKEVCFEITDKSKNVAVGSIKLILTAVVRYQPMEFEYMTSEWEGISHSKHVCAGHGLCSHVGMNVGPDDDPDGVFSNADSRLMKSPGKTIAHPSAGCAGNGCFLCSSSCTYSRYTLSTAGKTPSMVYRKKGEITSSVQINIIITDGNGVESSTKGFFQVNQEISFKAFGGQITFQHHGYLTSDSSIIPSPDVVVITHDYKCFSQPGSPDCMNGAYGVKGTSVSEANNPKSGIIGDIQCPITGCDLTTGASRPKFDQGIVSMSQGRQTDNFRFLPSPLDEILKSSEKFPVNGWTVESLSKDAIQIKRVDKVDNRALLFSVITDGIVLSLSSSIVCPEISSVAKIMGEYNSIEGCFLDVTAKSVCQPGPTIVKLDISGFIPTETSFELTNDDLVIRIPGLCTSSQIEGASIVMCSGDKCTDSHDISSSLLNLPTTLLNISTVYSTGEEIGGDSVSFSLDLPSENSTLAAFYRFFSKFLGSDSWINRIMGMLLMIGMAVVLIMAVSYVAPMVLSSVRSMRRPKSS